ncbi:hypothetical protein ACFLV7_01665 [Chloroflexota bacterium]
MDQSSATGRGGINGLAHLGCCPVNPHREQQPAYQDRKSQKVYLPSIDAVIGVGLACAANVVGINLAVLSNI